MAGSKISFNSKTYLWRSTDDGEAVVLNINQGGYFTVKGVGVDVLELLSSHAMDAEQIAGEIHKKYDAPLSRVTADVEGFIHGCLEEGIFLSAAE